MGPYCHLQAPSSLVGVQRNYLGKCAVILHLEEKGLSKQLPSFRGVDEGGQSRYNFLFGF
jgi:hypothetical protein